MEKTTKQKADELVKSFEMHSVNLDSNDNDVKHYIHSQKISTELAIECAIICQEREVKNNEKTYKCLIKYGVHSDAYRRLTSKFNEAQELLTELKSRL